MDVATLLASAGVSAVVGAVVSVLAVSQTTVRRAKAERADAARQAVQAVVAPMRDELARYEFRQRPEPLRGPGRSHMDDHAAVVQVLDAATGLPAWRRWLVARRCRRVFGAYWTDLAIEYPGDPTDAHTFSAWLASSLTRGRGSIPRGAGPLDGLLQRAYSELPGHSRLKDLRDELRSLSHCR